MKVTDAPPVATQAQASTETSQRLLDCTRDANASSADCARSNSVAADAAPQSTAAPRLAFSQKPLDLPGLQLVEPVKLGETDHVKIKIDGQDRDVYLHLPAHYDASKSMPLMLVYNGLNTEGGPANMDRITQLGKKADEDGFAVAFLAGGGMKGGWNNGQLPFDRQDDVKFTNSVIDTLQSDLNIDKDRTYLVGISWGGSMMHKALSQLSDKVAAAVDIAGFMTGKEKWNNPDDHVSALIIHSQDDQTVPTAGRTKIWHDISGFHQEPTESTWNFYRKQDGMQGEPTVSTTYDASGSPVVTRDIVNPIDGTELKMVTLSHLAHGWPGAYDLPSGYSATDQAVDFLLKHSRPHKPKEQEPEAADKPIS
jgi:polyhydroxybutyrate depolymerase